MLTHLSIKNLAIADALALDFSSGLSVLTGETGAGKSIIIDALGLALGDRGDVGVIKQGASRADISASFDCSLLPAVKALLDENALSEDEDDICIIKRSILSNGRSKGFINAQPVPISLLKKVGEKLLTIHGQHAHQALLHSDNQRILLDQYGQLNELNDQINTVVSIWEEKSERYQSWVQQKDELLEKKDFLHFQLQELSSFEPQENEYDELEAEYKRLSHANQIIDKLQQAQQELIEGEPYSADSLLSSAHKSLEDISDFDEQLSAINEMLANALIQISEANSEISHYLQRMDNDPERLAELEERLSQYHELARKHHCAVDKLAEKYLELQKRYQDYEQSDELQDGLVKEISQLEAQYQQLAQKLSAKRSKVAKELADKVEKNIHQLGITHGKFEISLVAKVDSKQNDQMQTDKEQVIHKLWRYGQETIQFLVAANPGQTPAPLIKVASGGELSRISLAIQVVTAECHQTPCLIFDEVDVGVGGKVAEKIGAKLKQLSRYSQILCVTHQSQVAIHGDCHFLVEKEFAGNSTSSTIKALSDSERIDELARMLSGAEITDTTRLHAKEMLEQAQNHIT